MVLKKTTKYFGKLKGLHFENDKLIDENGEIIDLVSLLKDAYEAEDFELSVTSKHEEETEI